MLPAQPAVETRAAAKPAVETAPVAPRRDETPPLPMAAPKARDAAPGPGRRFRRRTAGRKAPPPNRR